MQNPQVHDVIMYASHVTGRGQECGLCMVLKKDCSTVNIQEFFVFCNGGYTEEELMR